MRMSYFWGCSNIGMILVLLGMSFLFFEAKGSPASQQVVVRGEEVDDDPIFGLSSREDLVQLAGYGEDKVSNVVVTGSVLCEACMNGEPQLHAWPLSGASVAVSCNIREKGRRSRPVTSITDEYGEFTIDLPSHLHAIPNLNRKCVVKLLRIPKKSQCRPAHVRKNKRVKLLSVENEISTYTAGTIRLLYSGSKPTKECGKERRLKAMSS